MKIMKIPRGVKIACGTEVHFIRLSRDGEERVDKKCGENNEYCPTCAAFNDANCVEDVE